MFKKMSLSLFALGIISTSAIAGVEPLQLGLWDFHVTAKTQMPNSTKLMSLNNHIKTCVKPNESPVKAFTSDTNQFKCTSDNSVVGDVNHMNISCKTPVGTMIQKGWFTSANGKMKSHWIMVNNVNKDGHALSVKTTMNVNGKLISANCGDIK